jgi:hypothetical protein
MYYYMAYWFKVVNPNVPEIIPQLNSQQKPFFFGGSQVPVNLALSKNVYSGAGFTGDAPPKKYPISREGKPMYHVLKYPGKMSSTGNGVKMPLRR